MNYEIDEIIVRVPIYAKSQIIVFVIMMIIFLSFFIFSSFNRTDLNHTNNEKKSNNIELIKQGEK